MYRYILRESCSQFDSLPLTSLNIIAKLVLGCVFKCLEPALLVAAALSQRSPFTAPSDWDERDRAHAARAAFDSMSDHIAALRAYRTWESLGGGGGGAARWARANYVSIPDLKGMRDTARQYRTHLARLGVASLYDARRAADGAFDVRSDNAALLKAMLVAAFYPCVAPSFFFPRFLLFAHLFCLSFQVRRDDWRPGEAARRRRRGGAAQRRGGARLSHARRLRQARSAERRDGRAQRPRRVRPPQLSPREEQALRAPRPQQRSGCGRRRRRRRCSRRGGAGGERGSAAAGAAQEAELAAARKEEGAFVERAGGAAPGLFWAVEDVAGLPNRRNRRRPAAGAAFRRRAADDGREP